MNPFETFLAKKSILEADKGLMTNLEIIAQYDALQLQHSSEHFPSITYLGGGQQNEHFRVGHLDGRSLATREYVAPIMRPKGKLHHPENYIAAIIKASNEGKRVPGICGAIKVEKEKPSYFLLLEDLTADGQSDFVPGTDGERAGTINGEPVHYDFDTLMPFNSTIQYLTDNNVITISI